MPATLTIKPWPDPLLDTLGHDPAPPTSRRSGSRRSDPTAVLLLRHLAGKFERHPGGLELAVADTSQALGLGQRDGNSSPIVRTLNRLVDSSTSRATTARDTVAVRRNLPPINPRHVRRLPAALQSEHADWARGAPRRAAARRRPSAGPARWRSRCSSRATTPITRSACSPPPASTPRSATTRRAGRTSATAPRSTPCSPTPRPRVTRPSLGSRDRPRDHRRLGRVTRRAIVVLTGRRHLDRVGHPRLPRPAGRVDEEPGGREDGDAPVLPVGSRDPEAGVAEPRRQRDVARRAQRRAPRARRARARGPPCTRSSPRTSTGCTSSPGSSPERIVEIHGTVHALQVHVVRLARARWTTRSTGCAPARTTRACLDCGGILKSATISFGENLVARGPRAVAARRGRERPLPRAGHVARRLPRGRPARGRARERRPPRDRQRAGDAVRPRRRARSSREQLGDVLPALVELV